MALHDRIQGCPIDGILNDPRCAYCRAFRGMRDAQTIFVEVGEWGAETFPASTDQAKLAHLAKEFDELRAAPSSGEEMADMVMILSHLAYAHGVDLMAEIGKKLEVCRARRWGRPDAEGVVEHIRD
jgi:hypothetical protein